MYSLPYLIYYGCKYIGDFLYCVVRVYNTSGAQLIKQYAVKNYGERLYRTMY
jgi:hypothetical protein